MDATEWVDEIKVPKSEEEIGLLRGTAALQDACIEHLRGVHQARVCTTTRSTPTPTASSRSTGSERGLVQVNSGPLGTMVPFDVPRFQNRVIQNGDQVSVLIEVNGPGGYYCEVMRIYTVGAEPSQDLKDAFATSPAVQTLIASRFVPGAQPKDIWDEAVAAWWRPGMCLPPVPSVTARVPPWWSVPTSALTRPGA